MQEFIRDSRKKILQVLHKPVGSPKKYLLVNYFMRLSQNMRNFRQKKRR